MTKQRLFNFLVSLLTSCFLLLLFLLYGCGYSIQTKANLPFDTIAVGKIQNKTLEPKLEDKFHLSLAQTFSQYGFSISPSARYRLDGEIFRFNLLPTTEVNLTATQYQVEMLASFRLVDTETGNVMPLVANSPFITYFPATGRIEFIMAQKELAEVSAMSNLSQSLVQRIIYDTPKNFTYLFFKPEEIMDVGALTVKLREAKDPLSQYLREQLNPDVLRQIDAYNPFDYSATTLKAALVTQLNTLIQNKEIFDKKRFASLTLSDETERLIRQNPQGLNLVRLNRVLLEEAYPGVFAKMKQIPGGPK